MKTQDFRFRLRQELIDRCKRNPAYSLRAFAVQLGMDASTLSKMLKGKRPLGRKVIFKLGARMGLSAEELASFVRQENGVSAESMEDSSFEQLALDRFAVIADWYHFAILELMQVKGFRGDMAWIARSLGLRLVEAETAVERLQRVGLLRVNANGTWEDLSGGFTTSIGPDMASVAHRRLQEQFLEKSMAALVATPLEDRDHSTVTMAASRARLPAAREKIKRFRRSLAKFLTEGAEHDEILNLNIALFPITTLNERKAP